MIIQFNCPICKKWSFGCVPPVNEDSIGIVAYDHDDHVVVVDYDADGIVKSVNAVEIINNMHGREIKCSRCNKPIVIPKVASFKEFAFVHEDHVAILYVFDENYYSIEIVDLYIENEVDVFGNSVRKVINIIGTRKLAEILIRVFVLKERTVSVPATLIRSLRYILYRLGEINLFILKPGKMRSNTHINAIFLERLIKSVLRLPEKEALLSLKQGIEFIVNISEAAAKYLLNNKIDLLTTLLDSIKDTGLLELIIFILKKKFEKKKNYLRKLRHVRDRISIRFIT